MDNRTFFFVLWSLCFCGFGISSVHAQNVITSYSIHYTKLYDLSIATDKEKENTAYSMLSAYVKMSHPKNRIFVIHRLDRETSGVMMYAKNLQTQQSMQSSWKETVSERTYVALVEGMVGQQKGSVRSKLIENKANMVFSNISGEQGKDAITHYEVIKSYNFV